MRKALSVFLVFATTTANAAPIITGLSGTPGDNNTLTISGSSFGTKSVAKPLIFTDFEDGTLNPTALGTSSTWNVEYKAIATDQKRSGTYSAKSTPEWLTNSVNLRTSFSKTLSDPGRGGHLFVSFWRRADYGPLPGNNWKFIRFWHTGSTQYPNLYVGQAPGESARFYYTEQCGIPTHKIYDNDWTYPNTTWRHEEYMLKMNSATSAADGTFRVKINSVNVIDNTVYPTDCSANPGTVNQFYIMDDPSNFTPTGNSWIDDVYVDDSWSRVYIGNAATYATCTQMELQPASAWTSSQITVTQKHGNLTGSSAKYIYVCDSNDTCNSTGFLLSAASATPAPTVGSVTPTSGADTGDTTISVVGTGFLPGALVYVGGVLATDITVSDSENISAQTPAGTGTVDVTVLNSDGQTGALLNAFTYTTSVVTSPAQTGVCPCVHLQ